MSVTEIISRQVQLLPKSMQGEVLDFIEFLLNKKKRATTLRTKRKPGLAKGLVEMRKDFDEPLDDFKEYM
ncbi:MAG TPA: DUF2281 domain-containing protein [Flavobacteriaceae bacterium]|nr:DUF2281 domain-containing protein [Flavobacteriaceae bacterium]